MSEKKPRAEDILELGKQTVRLIVESNNNLQIEKLQVLYEFASNRLHIIINDAEGNTFYRQIYKHRIKVMSLEYRLLTFLGKIGEYNLEENGKKVLYEVQVTYIRLGPGRRGKTNVSITAW